MVFFAEIFLYMMSITGWLCETVFSCNWCYLDHHISYANLPGKYCILFVVVFGVTLTFN